MNVFFCMLAMLACVIAFPVNDDEQEEIFDTQQSSPFDPWESKVAMSDLKEINAHNHENVEDLQDMKKWEGNYGDNHFPKSLQDEGFEEVEDHESPVPWNRNRLTNSLQDEGFEEVEDYRPWAGIRIPNSQQDVGFEEGEDVPEEDE